MIVRDKPFASMLGKEIKSGYSLMVENERVYILGTSWALEARMRDLGRETLAVLVKHLGYIPGTCCCQITKVKDEYVVQQQMPETFRENLEAYTDGDLRDCAYTGLTMGVPLYQMEDKRILAARVRTGILESAQNALADGERALVWMDADSTIRFAAFRPDEGNKRKPLWNALESVWWVTKE